MPTNGQSQYPIFAIVTFSFNSNILQVFYSHLFSLSTESMYVYNRNNYIIASLD